MYTANKEPSSILRRVDPWLGQLGSDRQPRRTRRPPDVPILQTPCVSSCRSHSSPLPCVPALLDLGSDRFTQCVNPHHSPTVHYSPNPVHRNRTPGKSQWRIQVSDEIRSFELCVESAWYRGGAGWGLHIQNGRPAWLGVTRDHVTLVFLAKFVASPTGEWHGYPADHVRNNRDIPQEFITRSWLDSELLTRPTIRKIVRGQRCSL